MAVEPGPRVPQVGRVEAWSGVGILFRLGGPRYGTGMAAVGNQQEADAALARCEEGVNFVISQRTAAGLQIVGAKSLVKAVGFIAILIRLVGAVAGVGDDQAVAQSSASLTQP